LKLQKIYEKFFSYHNIFSFKTNNFFLWYFFVLKTTEIQNTRAKHSVYTEFYRQREMLKKNIWTFFKETPSVHWQKDDSYLAQISLHVAIIGTIIISFRTI